MATINSLVTEVKTVTSNETVTPVRPMKVVAGADNVAITLGSGPYIGYELEVYSQHPCSVSYTGVGPAATTDSIAAGFYVTYIWTGTYWIRQKGTVMYLTDNTNTLHEFYILVRR